ncbi:2-amino-5-chlorophenol 1,6-dioxygenase subunit alpha [Amycolatopsis jejuensis]|uniref:DODA-type extradiol aromatic ring-opening family dioxygenase n=1 Tax=Amycolatopsis jejuensis TaxID=330084 RepID=UPI000524C8DE|nr:2-amino-5-chlorophenol 1,6-dioxygenase subunit alpha [Amycolatopsis jejuensis]
MTTPCFAGAALIPGMPQLLAERPAESWAALAAAAGEVRTVIERQRPDALVLLSTQWFTVLGHQFQLDPHPRGRHVDENWYDFDYGHLDYSFPVDVELTEAWAAETEGAGFQARRTRYEHFPIDTGTMIGQRLLNPSGDIATAMVSCNLYAAADDLGTIAAAALRAAEKLGRSVFFVAISGLSSGLIQHWIQPEEDAVFSAAHEQWDRRILDLLTAGDLGSALELREEYAQKAQADSQFRALAFLAGTGKLTVPATVHAYGPLWGTGGAVIHWPVRGDS